MNDDWDMLRDKDVGHTLLAEDVVSNEDAIHARVSMPYMDLNERTQT